MDKIIVLVTLIVLVVALTVEHNTRKAQALSPVVTLTTEAYSHKCVYEKADFSDIKNGNVTFNSKICY